jgi:hypothetical protein
MAVIRVTTLQTFTVLSSDTKPTTDVPTGSRLIETDTGLEFVYDGTTWKVLVSAVQGNVAHDAADVGNPGLLGARALTGSPSSVGNGDRTRIWADEKGRISVFLGEKSANGNVDVVLAADAMSASRRGLGTISMPHLYNNSTLDRLRNIGETAYLASAARTATVNGAVRVNYNFRGLYILVDVTTGAATPGVTLKVELRDSLGGFQDLCTVAAAITSTSAAKYAYLIYPLGAENAEGLTEHFNMILPSRDYRVTLTHGDTDSLTYSVDVTELP